jgi:hypothetical protein
VNRDALPAAVRDLRALAAARRRAKAPSPKVGLVLDAATSVQGLIDFPANGDRLTYRPSDADVLAILGQHDLLDIVPAPRAPRGAV